MKLTPEYLEEQIATSEYLEAFPMIICVLTTVSGFKLTGTSAPIDPNNFDKQIGNDIAYKNAFEKLWELEGYHARKVIHGKE
jgi:hypothetical protein